MRKRWWQKWIAALAVSAALVAISPVGEAAAKRQKVIARINGKRFKSGKASTLAFVNSFTVSIGAGVVPRRVHGTVRGFGIVCLIDDFAAQPLPLTLPCAADYYEQTLGTAVRKQWDTATGILVTFESFDGTWMRGTFEGILEIVEATHAGDPPAAVEKGKFKVIASPL